MTQGVAFVVGVPALPSSAVLRNLRVWIFVVTGLLQGLAFLDEFFFHFGKGDVIHYVFMALYAVGSIACLRVARIDWRAARHGRLAK